MNVESAEALGERLFVEPKSGPDAAASKSGAAAGAVGVIMAGGSGTRFWPYSRARFPKQYLPFARDGRTLIRATYDRIAPLTGTRGILVVTAGSQRPLVLDQLPNASVLVEPVPRNTAACLALAAVKVLHDAGDLPMICLPADHLIDGEDQISEIYRKGIDIAASSDRIVTIGIKPAYPETGYGYIEAGKPVASEGSAVPAPPAKGGDQTRGAVLSVSRFVEKPSREVAADYIAAGRYYWNSGMFIVRPSVLLAACEKFVPLIHSAVMRISAAWDTPAAVEVLRKEYDAIPPVSIDVGVMERAPNVVMLPGDSFSWSDVGSWSAWLDEIESLREGDEKNIGVHADTLFVDCERVAVVGHHDRPSKRLVAAVGVRDLVVVETEDAILICHRDRTQEVKKVVETLKSEGKERLL